jgi:hypothetical protein
MGAINQLCDHCHSGLFQRYRRDVGPFVGVALQAARSRLLADMMGHILEIGAGLGQSFPR